MYTGLLIFKCDTYLANIDFFKMLFTICILTEDGKITGTSASYEYLMQSLSGLSWHRKSIHFTVTSIVF